MDTHGDYDIKQLVQHVAVCETCPWRGCQYVHTARYAGYGTTTTTTTTHWLLPGNETDDNAPSAGRVLTPAETERAAEKAAENVRRDLR